MKKNLFWGNILKLNALAINSSYFSLYGKDFYFQWKWESRGLPLTFYG